MNTTYKNININQGSSYSSNLAPLTDEYGNIFDLEDYSVNSQIRKSYYSSNTTASFNTSMNVTSGVITLSLDANVTSNIYPGRYVYDTLIYNSSNNYIRIVEGVVQFSPSVTR